MPKTSKPLSQYERIELIETARKDMETYKDGQQLLAEARMIAYQAHVDVGFTPEQALYLCDRRHD
jgi:hypothetical protein